MEGEGKEGIRFIDGVIKGSKVLVLGEHIFYANRKTAQSTHFKCSHRKTKGCGASVTVYKINYDNYSFDSFKVINGEHRNHPPSSDKIRRMEEKAREKKLKMGSEGLEEDHRRLHVCLFCCDNLPEGYGDVAYLEETIAYHHDPLRISLDNPEKNKEAFGVLCDRLGVNWRRKADGFDPKRSLPLCSKCQGAYQQLFQLHVQIRQLERLIGETAEVIRMTITGSEGEGGGRRQRRGGNKAGATLPPGMEEFRKMVINSEGHETKRSDKLVKEVPPPKKPRLCSSSKMTPESGGKAAELGSPPLISRNDIVKLEETTTAIPGDPTSPEDDEGEPLWMGGDDEEQLPLEDGVDDDDEYLPPNSDSDLEQDSSKKLGPLPKVASKKSRRPILSFSDRKYICHLCPAELIGHKSLHSHYSTEHPLEVRYTCKHCNRHFRDLRDCHRHQAKHTEGTGPRFNCSHCSTWFKDQHLLQLHQQRHSSSGDLPPNYKCPTCGKDCPSMSALSGHMTTHNPSLLLCKICGRSFQSRGAFQKHNRRLHDGQAEHSEPVQDPPSSTTLVSLGIPPEIPEPTRLKCHLCWTPILGRLFLDNHFRDNHPDHIGGLTSCRCGKSFKQYKDCVRHAIRHSDLLKAYQCDQCPAAFHTARELESHSVRHQASLEQRRTVVCDQCGVGVVSDAALRKHKRKHEDPDKRWVCEDCGRSYRSSKGLLHHNRTEHLRHLAHKCGVCDKAFPIRAELVKHTLRRHATDKPFQCPHCDKCFSYAGGRDRHVRGVHGSGEKRRRGPRRQRRKKAPRASGDGMEDQVLIGELVQVEMETASSHHSLQDIPFE